ncbi:hypothetical protein H5410_061988 [Solanum commersonii]|uniref:Polyprotein protein n=1 Tax=Solanum commersonii TaxID=4109 RepID=A0A9J5WB98_SOLCO|nr:hypothetical protein H5410_061988 [Solanum commersonii]
MIERAITTALTPLMASIDVLTVRVESTDFTSLFGTLETPDDLSAKVPVCAEVPSATTGDDTMDDVASIYVMFEIARQASLRDTSMVSSSGAYDDETPDIDAQLQSVTPGIDAQTDEVTKMQMSPRLSLTG